MKRFEQLREAALNLGMSQETADHYAGEALKNEAIQRSRFDHQYEPGAYSVCRRCGCERH